MAETTAAAPLDSPPDEAAETPDSVVPPDEAAETPDSVAPGDSGDPAASVDSTASEPTRYTSESTGPAPTAAPAPRPAVTRPGAATGRRKEAVARVRLLPGSGKWSINGRSLEEYFPNKVHQQAVQEPFKSLDLDGQYDVIARIAGGGSSGQAGALRHGIARALNDIDVEGNRPALKKAGFLTRDSRMKERKKYGLKKARKAPQYSKR